MRLAQDLAAAELDTQLGSQGFALECIAGTRAARTHRGIPRESFPWSAALTGMTIDITETTFEQTIEKGIVLIDWWASWCGPCRAFAPIYERAAQGHPDIAFGKVNTEVERGLAAAFEIQSIPTLMVFRDGILVFAQPGALPPAALEKLIAQVRALDMDTVRHHVAELQTAAS